MITERTCALGLSIMGDKRFKSEWVVRPPEEALCDLCGRATKVIAVSWPDADAAKAMCLIDCKQCGKRTVTVERGAEWA